MLIPFFVKAETVIALNGYYHNEKAVQLSTKNRIINDIRLANEILHFHGINGYRFALGDWQSIEMKVDTFYKPSLDGEAHLAYSKIKGLNKNAPKRIDFYVRDYLPELDGKVRGVAVQGGNFFALTYQKQGVYYTFQHELFHLIGLGDSSLQYPHPYVCGAKVTLMDERHLPSESKSYYLSDPKVVVNGQQCGHDVYFDNARRLRELLEERFGSN